MRGKSSQAKKEGGFAVRRTKADKSTRSEPAWSGSNTEFVEPSTKWKRGVPVQKAESRFKWHSLWLWIHRFSQQILIKHLLCAIASSMYYWYSREHNRAMSLLSQTRLCWSSQVFTGTLTMTDAENHWRIWERSNMTWLMFPKNNLLCGK